LSSSSTRKGGVQGHHRFREQEQVSGAAVTAIGAFAHAQVGWFGLAAKKLQADRCQQQCEVLSLIGDVAESDDGKASLHLHAVLGLQDGSVRGGHFCRVQCGRRWKSRSTKQSSNAAEKAP